MATGEQLIERLGGGGPVGLAVAAVVLAPTLLPPVRRGLRGLAKAVIIQYLRVSELRVPAGPASAGAAAGKAAARRGRRRGGAEAAAPPSEATAPPARARARGGRAAAAPEPEAPTAAPPRPRRSRGQSAASNNGGAVTPAAAPARAPRARRGEGGGQPEAAAASRARETTPAASVRPGAAPETAAGESRGGARDGKLNLNTASRAELTRLPRVGAQTADRIIQFREQQGPIRNLRQLRQADILPLAAYRQIRELVRV